MTAGLKPYPTYRGSGPDWLDAMPETWRVLRARYLFREVDERSLDGTEPHLSMSQQAGLVPNSEIARPTLSSESYAGGKLCRPGDLVLNRLKAHLGVFAVARQAGVISPDYTVLRAKQGTNVPYYGLTLRSEACRPELRTRAKGIVEGFWRLYTDDFYDMRLPAPPADDQSAIVRYLGYVSRRSSRYIRAKLQVIGLLEEQKRNIISNAVLGRIDVRTSESYGTYADSGLSSLGAVPRHWDCVPLKRRWSVTDCKHVTVPFSDEGIPLAGLREVQSFVLSLDDAKRTSFDWYETLVEGGREPKRGDLIYCRNVSVGACAIVDTDERMAMGQDVCLLRSRRENQRFLNYFLHSQPIADQLAALSIGSTFSRINVADVKSLVVAVPPREEQDAIANHLDEATARVDSRVAAERKQIALIREYQSRLTSDVVTGKVDVRESAAQMLDESAEDEPFDDSGALDGDDGANREGALSNTLEEVEA